ncbi:hypothetical protein [Rhodopseudomonas sp. BR0M22]|uniref:hypothetical protein n=1 Tax=Rhodopseudomonas sp. BR0M22 TaxID=2269369 RepID=UPI0013E08089|nr:hypothetical protein [Rhodopseudomonas sp. BR0M22]NEW92800.1 hypothetical protein [Rhodopseudomonas sp. BR0M22]
MIAALAGTAAQGAEHGFDTVDAVTGAIDENRTLPYKPRQLSAMTRLCPGRFIFGLHPAHLWAGITGLTHH